MNLLVSKSQHEARIAACDSCEHKKFMLGIAYCGKCNCGLGGKQMLTVTDCPLKKWPTIGLNNSSSITPKE